MKTAYINQGRRREKYAKKKHITRPYDSKRLIEIDPAFTADYHDPEKRAIANAITLEFTDGTRFEEVVVEYPIGHARRRQDGIPKLVDKFKINLARQFPTRQQQRILEVSLDRARLEQMPVNEYLDLYVI